MRKSLFLASIPFLGSLFLLGWISTPAFAGVLPPASRLNSSPSKLQIHSFPTPPKTFNPLTATNTELKHYGFPTRPTQSTDLSRWTKAMKSIKHIVKPRLVNSGITHIPPTGFQQKIKKESVKDTNFSGTAAATNPIWSGYMDYDSSGPGFNEAYGTFTVPSISSSSPSGSHYSSWLGIGGFSFTGGHQSPYVMQAGVDVVKGESEYPAWWEIAPVNSEQYISTLTVYPKDEMYVDVSYNTSDSGTFVYFIEDVTKGEETSGSVSGVSKYFDKREVEAITEANQDNGVSKLGDFGKVEFEYTGNTIDGKDYGNSIPQSEAYTTYKLTAESSSTGHVLIYPGSPFGSEPGITDDSFYNYFENLS